jgi:hypothetical protein
VQTRQDQRAKTRGQQLQRERDLVEENRGDRNHQDQKHQREEQNPKMPPAVHEQRDAAKQTDDRRARQEQLGAEHAGDEGGQTGKDDGQPHRGRPGTRRGELLTPFPGEIHRQRHDEKPVRVVVVGRPVVDELDDDILI